MAFSFAGFYKSLDLKTKKAAGFLPAALISLLVYISAQNRQTIDVIIPPSIKI